MHAVYCALNHMHFTAVNCTCDVPLAQGEGQCPLCTVVQHMYCALHYRHSSTVCCTLTCPWQKGKVSELAS